MRTRSTSTAIVIAISATRRSTPRRTGVLSAADRWLRVIRRVVAAEGVA